jgi:uncharacterized glyoxalase superfamily protein PhnB
VNIRRITPLLFVPEVEPCVKFWTERLGFKSLAEVPDGQKLAFALLEKDGTQVMYQTYASVQKDMPALEPLARKGPSFLYIEVDDLDGIKAAVQGADVYMTERTTFYGAREIGIKDPAGHCITFAEFAQQPPD